MNTPQEYLENGWANPENLRGVKDEGEAYKKGYIDGQLQKKEEMTNQPSEAWEKEFDDRFSVMGRSEGFETEIFTWCAEENLYDQYPNKIKAFIASLLKEERLAHRKELRGVIKDMELIRRWEGHLIPDGLMPDLINAQKRIAQVTIDSLITKEDGLSGEEEVTK